MKKFIDVSGYGHSGKSAVSEFLKDFDDVFSLPTQVEFELFRVPGGLLDLYFSIYYNWNLIRSSKSLTNFRKLILRIGTVQNKLKPWTLWNASGHGYEQFFNNKFIETSEDYIDSLIVFKQKSYWPYDNLNNSKWSLLKNKVINKLKNKVLTSDIYFTDKNQFLEKTSNYIHNLFNEVGNTDNSHIVLNNAFEPFNPSIALSMLENSCSIIVDRDPRDIYASMINSNEVFVPKFEKYKNLNDEKKKMISFNDINQFIERFRTLKNNVYNEDNSKVLRIKYEDFILKHDETSRLIFNHIGLTNFSKNKNSLFNVHDSKKNIGLWKKYRDLPEIIQIETQLANYCYQVD
ncbi:sulfotransferase [Flavobacteriaceae bacterium]|nr:sulfotransferase [Flavobacteriaceae bacterium]